MVNSPSNDWSCDAGRPISTVSKNAWEQTLVWRFLKHYGIGKASEVLEEPHIAAALNAASPKQLLDGR